MRRVVCWMRGHDSVAVAEDGATLFTPGIPFPMPSMRYRVDPDGPHRACRRCGVVEQKEATSDL